MSVDLVYERIAIRISENELFYLGNYGSSNCTDRYYDANDNLRERGSRQWSSVPYNVYSSKTRFIFSKENYRECLLKHAKYKIASSRQCDSKRNSFWNIKNRKSLVVTESDPKEINFSYYNDIYGGSRYNDFTYGKLINSIKHGLSNAITLEKVLSLGVTFYRNDNEGKSIILENINDIRTALTNDHYIYPMGIDRIVKNRTASKNSGKYVTIKSKRYVDDCFIIRISNEKRNGFIKSVRGEVLKYYFSPNKYCKLFETEKKALAFIKKNKILGEYQTEIIQTSYTKEVKSTKKVPANV